VPGEHRDADAEPLLKRALTIYESVLSPDNPELSDVYPYDWSPDGRWIAVRVSRPDRTAQIGLVATSNLSLTVLKSIDWRGPTKIFFSPDGNSIGMITAGGVLNTVSLQDGLSTTVTEGVNFLYGAAWLADDTIVFVRNGTLWRIDRNGGAPVAITTLGPQESMHGWPLALPGGKAILFSVLSGDDNVTLPLMSVGGRGVISVVANIVPRETAEMTHAALAGDWKLARDLHLKLFPLSRAMFIETNPIPVKEAMGMMGTLEPEFRLPMCPMGAANRERLKTILVQHGLLKG
jgi:hypothetical protein